LVLLGAEKQKVTLPALPGLVTPPILPLTGNAAINTSQIPQGVFQF